MCPFWCVFGCMILFNSDTFLCPFQSLHFVFACRVWSLGVGTFLCWRYVICMPGLVLRCWCLPNKPQKAYRKPERIQAPKSVSKARTYTIPTKRVESPNVYKPPKSVSKARTYTSPQKAPKKRVESRHGNNIAPT